MALTKVTGQVIKNTTDVTVGVLTVTNTLAVGGTVSIGGTLTYEDVTNIDSVGLITARNGINVSGGNIIVGSATTLTKDGDATFTGIVTAASFSGSFTGDISNATGQASGLGTALSQTQTDVLNKVYYTNSVLKITSNTVVDTPSSAAGAYTNYAEIKVDDGNTFTVRSGDEFKLNVLGIGTLSNY